MSLLITRGLGVDTLVFNNPIKSAVVGEALTAVVASTDLLANVTAET